MLRVFITGSVVDPDGYTVVLDGETILPIGVSNSETFVDVAVGDHELELTGIADNCAAIGPNPVSVTITEAAETQLAFAVACPPFYDHIAFNSNRDGNDEIYVMRADGSDPVNLTNHPATDDFPAWSPHGDKIAFVTDRDGNGEIYVMDVDGSNPINLTNHSATDYRPTWSPDGGRLAFVSNRDDDHDIWLMDADGSNPVNLTPGSTRGGYAPAWSPDGTGIAFVAFTTVGDEDIYVMSADGSDATNLTNHPGIDDSPAWSPDGNRIVFVSYRDSFYGQLFVMGADGSNPTHLITHNCIVAVAGVSVKKKRLVRFSGWKGEHERVTEGLLERRAREEERMQALIAATQRRLDRQAQRVQEINLRCENEPMTSAPVWHVHGGGDK